MPDRQDATQLLITARRLIVDADTPPIDDAAVLVVGARIHEVGRRSEVAERASSGHRHIDAGDRTLLPGLVDMHFHPLNEGGERHDPDGDRRRTVEVGTSNLHNALSLGVTTVRDAGSWDDEIAGLMRLISRGELIAPRVLPTGAPLTSPRGHAHWWGGETQGEPALVDAVRRKAASGMTHVKVMATGGTSTAGSDPRRPQYSEAELRAITQEAARHGLRTMAHVTSTEGLRRCLAAGIGSLEHCRTLSPQGTPEHPDDLFRQIAASGCWVDPTPASQYRLIMSPPPDADPAQIAELRAGRTARIEVYRRLLAAGHRRWLVGTDTGWSNPQDTYPIVCQVMADEIGMAPRDVLRAATSDAARALGLEREIGSIRPGYAADIIAVDGDPMSDASSLAKIRLVIAGGVEADQASLAAAAAAR